MPLLRAELMVTPSLRLERLIGEGAMGSVWLADHLTLDTKVAIKFIATDHREKNREAVLARFEREAKAAAQIKSPHVVHMYDHGVMEDGTPYIVMEMLEGESLGTRLRRGAPLAVGEVSQVVTQVAKALAKAHELGIVHRDIKPDNLFLAPSDDELFVKVLDFGIAKSTTDPNEAVTTTGALLGTPLYMSPELVQSSREASHHADLWALAVVAYEALTGKPPFTGETVGKLFFSICGDAVEPPSSRRQELPPGLDDWFTRALCQDQDKRFPSARAFARAFTAAISSSPREDDAGTAAVTADGEGTEVDPALLSTGDFLARQNLDTALDEGPEPTEPPGANPADDAQAPAAEEPARPTQLAAHPTLEGAATDVSVLPRRPWYGRPIVVVGATAAAAALASAGSLLFLTREDGATSPEPGGAPAEVASALPGEDGTTAAEVPLRISCPGGCDRVELDNRIYRRDEFAGAASQHGEPHTPGELQIKVAAGKHRIRVEKDGYLAKAEDIDVPPGTPFERSYELKPKTGRLPPDVLQTIIGKAKTKYEACYEVAQRRDPRLRGKVFTEFVIGVRGEVDQVGVRGVGDETFHSCVAQSFRSLSFPAPEGGGMVEVKFPLSFAPAQAPPKPVGTSKKLSSNKFLVNDDKSNEPPAPQKLKGSLPPNDDEQQQVVLPPQQKK